uniref:O-methyltransferase C-terminal domain-containing protein n=1 Tax=Kalanchoe fedtschenkoi TaxID=63787 RepID=A0A7N0T1E1_KALFE
MEVLDVGGNAGAALERIISVWPDVKGVNFDLPHVISRAPFIEGVKHVAGDMFESLPDSKTILLKWVLHNWSDEQCLKLLKNCWRALPEEGGKVIVLEFVIPQDLERTDRAAVDAITLDFIMMALYGGKERTAAEFRDLAMAAGFISVSVVPVGDGIHVLELVK